MDARGDESLKEAPNAFLEMLWDGGVANKALMSAKMDIGANLGQLPATQREHETRAAMAQGVQLILQGRLTVGDRVVEPDLLERHPGGYRAGDFKAGAGYEGEEDQSRLKKSYAIRLSHSTSVLNELGLSDGTNNAFVIDGDGQYVLYPLSAAQGVRNKETWLESYESVVSSVRRIVDGSSTTLPALGATCKLCQWKTLCREATIAADDLSLIAELGRTKRDAMIDLVPTVTALANANLADFAMGKKTLFPGVGQDTLSKFKERAVLLSTPGARPYLKTPVRLPVSEKEVFFDIETSPMKNNFVYLHGFVERLHGQPETSTFLPCITPEISPEAEETAFRNAWAYLNERIVDSTIYYYAPFELVTYKELAKRYSTVCSLEEVEALFSAPNCIDLYIDVVKKATVWPTFDLSIKTLAVYLGFAWRDECPSGANSIQWFDEWASTGDPAILERILNYNEDDCNATGVVVDGIRQLHLKDAA